MATKTTPDIDALVSEIEALKSGLVGLGTELNRAKLMFFAVACSQHPGASRAYDLCGLTEQELRDRLAPSYEFLASYEISAIERGLQAGRLVPSDFTQSKVDPDDFNWVLVNREKRLWVPF